MVGKLLSLDLEEDGVIVSIVHPGFMRTEMTKGVGFDKYWDDGGGEYSSWWTGWTKMESKSRADNVVAVTPDEAAKTLVEWTEKLDISKSGEYWAPRGPRKWLVMIVEEDVC
jgi:short-subunit dehydrogenase